MDIVYSPVDRRLVLVGTCYISFCLRVLYEMDS